MPIDVSAHASLCSGRFQDDPTESVERRFDPILAVETRVTTEALGREMDLGGRAITVGVIAGPRRRTA
jgi:hypothetical protein